MRRVTPVLFAGLLALLPQGAYAAPSNDSIADAIDVPSIPFIDEQVVGLADVDPDEPSDCLNDPYFDYRDDLPGVFPFPYGTVWYRYQASADRTLHVRAQRNVGNEGRLGVFRTDGSNLVPIGCSEAYDPEYDGSVYSDTDSAEILFQAEQGEEYLFQVVEARDEYLTTWFSVRDALEEDLAILAMNVTNGPEGLEVTVETGPGRQRLFVSACETTNPQRCSTVFNGYLEHWQHGKRWEIRWVPSHCVGDFTIYASLSNPFAIDPAPSNNEASEATWMGAQGASFCSGLW